MVKQYADGYFINGAWHSGKFYELINESIEKQRIATVLDGSHLRPITPGCLVGLSDDGDSVVAIDYANRPVAYYELVETPYMHYLTMGALIVLAIMLIFMVAVGLL